MINYGNNMCKKINFLLFFIILNLISSSDEIAIEPDSHISLKLSQLQSLLAKPDTLYSTIKDALQATEWPSAFHLQLVKSIFKSEQKPFLRLEFIRILEGRNGFNFKALASQMPRHKINFFLCAIARWESCVVNFLLQEG